MKLNKSILLMSVLFVSLAIIMSVLSISLVSAQSDDCNLWCKIVYLFTGKMQVTGGTVAPLGIQQTETIIDNGDAGWNGYGPWDLYGNGGYGSDFSANGHENGNDYCTWSPSLSLGTYDVYVSWTTENNRATNVPYILYSRHLINRPYCPIDN